MLIHTKFNIPFFGNELTERKRLFEKLDSYGKYNQIFLTAPAGYGKTALVTSYIKAKKDVRFTWLTMDGEDNDEELFWSYFLLSFYRNSWVPKDTKERAEAMFDSKVSFNRLYLTSFINDVAGLGMQIVMVVDDFIEPRNEKIRQGLEFLMKYQPANLHLLLSGREGLTVGPAKSEILGNVLTLTGHELGFTREEATSFFRSTGIRLPQDKYFDLWNAVEGWAAGLQMMALTAKEGRELKLPLSVENKRISAYMTGEVINGLSGELIHFLKQTAPLEQFSPGLCDFIFERTDSRNMIQRLKKSNLFLICIDRKEEWFRYHSLFREFLQMMPDKKEDGIQSLIFRRAAQWYSERGAIKEAVGYALNGRDFEKAAAYIEACVSEIGYKGNNAQLHKWNRRLPEEIVKNNKRLLLNSAWAFSAEGKEEEVFRCIEYLKRLAPVSDMLRAEIAALSSANIAGPNSGLEGKLKECTEALRVLPQDSFLSQLICFNMGSIFLMKGCLKESIHYYELCHERSLKTGEIYLTVVSGKAMVTAQIRKGQLQEAHLKVRRLLKDASGPGGGILPATGLLYAELAEIHFQRNELEEAFKAAEEGCRIGELGEDIWAAGENYLILEKIYQAFNDRKGYERIRKKAVLCMEGRTLFDIGIKLECHHVRILIKKRKYPLAARKINRLEKMTGPGLMSIYPEVTLMKARLYMDMGEPRKAEDLLVLLKDAAVREGQNGVVCEALVMLSLVCERRGNQIRSLKLLEKAVDLAEEQGSIRVFTEEGEDMRDMLLRLLGKGKTEGREYIFLRILADSFSACTDRMPEDLPSCTEPLSDREKDILRLVASGADNAEIAERLFISVNTVKTHLLHIYGKLGVHSRLRAAAKAETLHILP